MTYVINLADTTIYPVDQSLLDELDSLESQTESLPRLEDLTVEYLDNISRQLQWDTFSEHAKQTYHDAWQQHFAELEIASILFHSQEGEATLPEKIVDNRIRFCEYQMDTIDSYGQRLNDEIERKRREVNDPEIGILELERLEERRDRMREQYAYIKNMRFVYLDRVRPAIEKRTGYTMGAYKSRKQLESETKAKQYRMYRKRLTMQEWSSLSNKEKNEYLAKNATVMSK